MRVVGSSLRAIALMSFVICAGGPRLGGVHVMRASVLGRMPYAPTSDILSSGRLTSGPRRGGTLTARYIFGINCLDPYKGNLPMAALSYERLLAADAHGRIRPGLATSWRFSHNGTRLTLHLRHDVRFSNGDPFDAGAVRANMRFVVKYQASTLVVVLKKVVAVNRYTVRLVLTQPLRTALDKLTTILIVDPKSETKANTDTCVHPAAGTGPFVFSGATPGFTQITYVRNPHYHSGPSWARHSGAAYLSKVVIKPIIDDAAAVSSLLTGDVDITRVPVTQLSRLHGAATQLHGFLENAELYLGFNQWRKPFGNPQVRRAFAEAVNRSVLLKVVNNGYGKVADSPVPATVPYYDSRAKSYVARYDPKDARKIFSAHHIKGPFTLETYTIPAFSTSAEVIQSELAQVGVKVNIVTKDVPPAQTDRGNGAFDLFVDIHRTNDLYADYFSSSNGAAAGRNWIVKTDKELNRLILDTRQTFSPSRLSKEFDALQRYMDARVIVDPLFSRRIILAARTGIKGWHMMGGGDPLSYPVFQDLYWTNKR